MPTTAPPRRLRILHLEDSVRDAELVRHRLEGDGLACSILVVNSKVSFEAALAGEPFDLIISDYNLPGYDGVTALRQAQVSQPDVPVILISGTVVEEQAVKCLQIGATDYLLKQRLERLVPAVQRAIQEADTRRTQKRAEEALSESEWRKAAILDSVLDCIVSTDANGTVIDFNAAAARTFGYTKTEAIGRTLADLIVPERFRDRHAAGVANYIATGEGTLIGKLIEIIAVRSDGSEIPVELTITSIRSGPATIFTFVLRDITARRQADAIRTQLASIVDSSDDAIVSLDLDDTILTWNAGAERLYGYTAVETIGRNRTLLMPAGKRGELTTMDRARRGEAGEPLETQRVRKDGSVVDISLTISPMTDATGAITNVSTIARDITGRKHAEAAVREERDRANRYLETAQVILISVDLEGRITLVNRYACALLGWTCEELLQSNFVEMCIPARLRDEIRTTLGGVLGGRDSTILVSPVVTRTGEERLIEWRHTLLRDGDGQPTGTISSGTDVTERTAAIEALRQAEERMRFALESAKVGIWDMDYNTGMLRWSDAMAVQYGMPPGTFGGTFDGFVERIHPDDRASMLEAIGKAVTAGGDFTVLHRATWPDGTVRSLAGAGRVLLGADGVAVRAVGISQDVTERRSLEAQFHHAQKMEAVGRLAAGVAHDFNNLLTVILGYCEVLIDDLGPTSTSRAEVVEIQKAGVRAAGLTRQLLTFSRKEIVELKLLDLGVVVTHMRSMVERLIGEDVKVIVATSRAPVRIMADRGQVEQIVLNLAVNARDAMPKGGTLTIETSAVELDEHYAKMHVEVKPGHYTVLTVSDTGTGMTADVQARLFEPFFTTKGVGKGTGLGLATVHGVATRFGGSVGVYSEVGIGTSFKVYFPRADAADAIGPAMETRPASGAETVLVVEDADGLRELTKRLLERQGYTALVAASAEEALQLFQQHESIDVLLTDVVMPGASGPELTRQLVEQRPGLKVVYMSGYTEDAIVHHGVIDPGITFLHKPFTADGLGRKIREVLDHKPS